MKEPGPRRFLEGIALALPILIVSAPFLFTARCLYGRDFQAYYRSHALYAQEMTQRDGDWPRWNGRQYAGTPYLGDFQGGLHYPPNLLYLVTPPERAYGLLFVFHMLVAAVGMHRLTRYFGLRTSASLLAGVAYSMSLSVGSQMDAGHLNFFVTQALAPWVFMLELRVMKRPSVFRIAPLAVAIAAVLLGGSPKDFGPLLLVALGLAVWTAVGARRRERPWKAPLGALVVSSVFGAMLASASLLPALEVARHAVWDPAGAPAGILAQAKELYIGALPLVLAPLAFRSSKRGPVLFFAIAGAVALAAALGAPRLPFRSLWVGVLSLSTLAAFGWDALLRGGPKFVSRPWAPFAALVLTAADLCACNLLTVTTRSAEDYAAPPWYAAVLGGEREDYRLLDLTAPDASPAAHGFRLLNGYDYPRLASMPTSSDALERLNVRWLVSNLSPPDDRWRKIAKHDGRILYEDRHVKRSAFILPAGGDPGPPLSIRRSANSIEVSGRSYQAEKLVLSESWMPGWKAYSQRHRVPVAVVFDALLGVDVPAGDWHVTFRYEPDLYRVGRILSSSALAALAGLLVAGMRRSKIAIS
jgi:hypothetical protein